MLAVVGSLSSITGGVCFAFRLIEGCVRRRELVVCSCELCLSGLKPRSQPLQAGRDARTKSVPTTDGVLQPTELRLHLSARLGLRLHSARIGNRAAERRDGTVQSVRRYRSKLVRH